MLYTMNNWIIEYYSEKVQKWVSKMPVGIRAHYARLTELLTEFGIVYGIENCPTSYE